jgi:hypothetical protein
LQKEHPGPPPPPPAPAPAGPAGRPAACLQPGRGLILPPAPDRILAGTSLELSPKLAAASSSQTLLEQAGAEQKHAQTVVGGEEAPKPAPKPAPKQGATYRGECATCGRKFNHPPALAVHQKSCADRYGPITLSVHQSNQKSCSGSAPLARPAGPAGPAVPKRSGSPVWFSQCTKCSRGFSHPPALAIHLRSCDGSGKTTREKHGWKTDQRKRAALAVGAKRQRAKQFGCKHSDSNSVWEVDKIVGRRGGRGRGRPRKADVAGAYYSSRAQILPGASSGC